MSPSEESIRWFFRLSFFIHTHFGGLLFNPNLINQVFGEMKIVLVDYSELPEHISPNGFLIEYMVE